MLGTQTTISLLLKKLEDEGAINDVSSGWIATISKGAITWGTTEYLSLLRKPVWGGFGNWIFYTCFLGFATWPQFDCTIFFLLPRLVSLKPSYYYSMKAWHKKYVTWIREYVDELLYFQTFRSVMIELTSLQFDSIRCWGQSRIQTRPYISALNHHITDSMQHHYQGRSLRRDELGNREWMVQHTIWRLRPIRPAFHPSTRFCSFSLTTISGFQDTMWLLRYPSICIPDNTKFCSRMLRMLIFLSITVRFLLQK